MTEYRFKISGIDQLLLLVGVISCIQVSISTKSKLLHTPVTTQVIKLHFKLINIIKDSNLREHLQIWCELVSTFPEVKHGIRQLTLSQSG